jgi:putative ABC transport system permease protein
MWKLTLRGMRAHKIRYVLTAVAVVLGIAFVSGTLVLTSTINNTFDELFTEIYAGTDAQVRGQKPIDSSFFGETQRDPVSREVLDQVKTVPGVAVADPGVDISYAQLIGEDGEPVGGGAGPPTFGTSWTDNQNLNPFRLEPGSAAPEANDEIVIDAGSADKGDFAVGDRVDVLTQKAKKTYTLVGIAKFGTANSPAGASVIQFTLAEAQRINDYTSNQFSTVNVVGAPDISQTELRDRIDNAIDDPSVEVVTGQQLKEENQSDIEEFLGVFNTILLFFAAVALFVSCFIIYNTFSIIVAQRAREMALLRAIGARKSQVTRSIVGESFVVGVIASAIGFGLGILLAGGLKALLDALGLDLPAGNLTIPASAPIASFVTGILVTMFSAIIPARKASRVPPVAAMRDVAVEARRNFGRRFAIALLVIIGGAALLLYALFGSPGNAILFVGIGAIAIFIGVFVMGPVIARPLSRFIGAPLPRIKGMTGTLARENAIRNPRRTASTAAALMVGVALVGFITIFAASAKESIKVTLDRELKTDFIVSGFTGFGGAALSPALAEDIGRLPEVAAQSGFRYAGFKVDGSDEFITAFDTNKADQLVDLGLTAGSFANMGVNDIAVVKEEADQRAINVGDRMVVSYPLNPSGRQVTVAAIYEGSEVGMSTDFVISLAAFDDNFPAQQRADFFIAVKLAPGVTPAEGQAALEPLVKEYPTAELQNNAEFRATQEAAINQVVNLVYGLLFLAVLIALIGIANTLALSIYERRRELGLLRAVGMNKSQVRSAVRWESVIIALLGTFLGLVIGLFFGWAVVRAVKDEGFSEFAIAPVQLIFVVVLAAVAGVGAALFPARRAAKLDILEAIATE